MSPSTTLPEDGVIDPVAVRLAAAGDRRVRLTHSEQLAALKIMVDNDAWLNMRTITTHLAVRPGVARQLLAELGYETRLVGTWSSVYVVRPKAAPALT